MWYTLALVIILLIVLYNYNLNRSFGYPPLLYAIIWFVSIFFHFLAFRFKLIDIYELSPTSLSVFTLGVIVFSIGGVFAKLKFGNSKSFENSTSPHGTNKISRNIFIISVLFLPFNAYESYQLANEYIIIDNLYMGLRIAYAEGQDVGFSKFGIIFSYVNFFIQLYLFYFKKGNKLSLYASFILSFCYCALSTGRTFFIILICIIFGVMIIFNRLKIKYILIGIISFLIIFIQVGISLLKGGSAESSLSENVSSISENIMAYFIGSLSAFDTFINSNYTITYGENSFRFIYAFLNKIGVTDIKLVKLENEFVSIPFETNVFTIYKNYFYDFGLIFMILVILIVSFIHTYYYYKAVNEKSFVSTFIYSILLYPLIMSFFQEQYLSLLPSWIYLMSIVYIIRYGFKKNKKAMTL